MGNFDVLTFLISSFTWWYLFSKSSKKR